MIIIIIIILTMIVVKIIIMVMVKIILMITAKLKLRSRSPSPNPRLPKFSAPSGGPLNKTLQKNKRLSLGSLQDTLGSFGSLASLGQSERKGLTEVPLLNLASMKAQHIGRQI